METTLTKRRSRDWYGYGPAPRVSDADRAAQRLANYRKDPARYLERQRLAGLPAVPPFGAENDPVPANAAAIAKLAAKEAADRAERRSLGEPEPTPADLAEMKSAHYLSELTDFCRSFRGERDVLKARLNHALMTTGIGLKVIRWQWGTQA